MREEKTVMVGCRVTTDVQQRIKSQAEAMGIDSSQVLRNAIANYLGDDLPPSLADRVAELEAIVEALNRRVSQLSNEKPMKRSKVARTLEARLNSSDRRL